MVLITALRPSILGTTLQKIAPRIFTEDEVRVSQVTVYTHLPKLFYDRTMTMKMMTRLW